MINVNSHIYRTTFCVKVSIWDSIEISDKIQRVTELLDANIHKHTFRFILYFTLASLSTAVQYTHTVFWPAVQCTHSTLARCAHIALPHIMNV